MCPGESKTSKRRLKARERWLEALELRKRGLTFAAIAKELGYADAATAYNAVMSALKETFREPAEELRDLEATRLDAMQEKLSSNIGPDNVGMGVIDRILRIMERRARMLGLDTQKTEVEVEIREPLRIIRRKEADDERED